MNWGTLMRTRLLPLVKVHRQRGASDEEGHRQDRPGNSGNAVGVLGSQTEALELGPVPAPHGSLARHREKIGAGGVVAEEKEG